MNIIDLDNQTSIKVPIDILEKIAQSLTKKEIELIITSNETIKELNNVHRAKNIATDVLSFPMESTFSNVDIPSMPLGCIVISSDFAREKSTLFKHTLEDELSLLFIHGLLHLLGFDHEVDRGEMRKKERNIIETFSLPKSLIIRTEEY